MSYVRIHTGCLWTEKKMVKKTFFMGVRVSRGIIRRMSFIDSTFLNHMPSVLLQFYFYLRSLVLKVHDVVLRNNEEHLYGK